MFAARGVAAEPVLPPDQPVLHPQRVMSLSPVEVNPYAAPAAAEAPDARGVVDAGWPLELWLTSLVLGFAATALGCGSLYVLASALATEQPALAPYFPWRLQLAPFAVGAANALVLAAFTAFALFRAVISEQTIWAGTVAMLLRIAAVLVALGGFMLAGLSLAGLLFVPAALGAWRLSACMERWRRRLHARRRASRTQPGAQFLAADGAGFRPNP